MFSALVKTKILLNLADRELHRQLRHWRTRQLLDCGQKTGGQLKLLQLTKKVQDLLQITKLYTVFASTTTKPKLSQLRLVAFAGQQAAHFAAALLFHPPQSSRCPQGK